MKGSVCTEKLASLSRLETEINVRSIVLTMILNISNAFLATMNSTPEQLKAIQAAFEQENRTIEELNTLLAANIGLINSEPQPAITEVPKQ